MVTKSDLGRWGGGGGDELRTTGEMRWCEG